MVLFKELHTKQTVALKILRPPSAPSDASIRSSNRNSAKAKEFTKAFMNAGRQLNPLYR